MEVDIKDLKESLLFWKHKQEQLSDDDAIVIINHKSEEINRYTVQLLSNLQKENGYAHIVVAYAKESVLQTIKENITIPWSCFQCTQKQVTEFCRFQGAVKLFERIYVNVFEDIDEGDGFCFEGYNGLSKKRL